MSFDRRLNIRAMRVRTDRAEKVQMLTADDIALVRATFARVVPIQDAAADLFYDRLFAVSPKLRELFPADLREQKRKLMQMIATAVGGLNDLSQLVPAVKALAARHSRFGVTTEHYRLVGEALLWTLERGLGRHFTPEVRSAWAKVYRVLAATMQAGAMEVAGVWAAE
jgi:nitric oxide dioxygenase